MKNMKKLISFLMAVVTVLNMFGLYSFVAVAEGDDELLGTEVKAPRQSAPTRMKRPMLRIWSISLVRPQ